MTDALLAIDVISTFEHEDGEKLLAAFHRRIAGMAEALEGARAAGIPVLYINDAAGSWDGDVTRHVTTALEGSGGDVIARLIPARGEAFLFKARYSAFDHTPLALLLTTMNVTRVLLTGASTEGCIVQSGIAARELGLKATILTDACATIDEELEAVALSYAEHVAGVRLHRGAITSLRPEE
jgi:nicotinamidase-related amidase